MSLATRLLLSALTALLFGFIAGLMALAAPPPNSDGRFHDWFSSLKQPGTNIGCCSISDCRNAPYRQTADGYEVFIDQRFDRPTVPGARHDDYDPGVHITNPQWWKVPANKILEKLDNPTGEAITCWSPSGGVLCFVRATET